MEKTSLKPSISSLILIASIVVLGLFYLGDGVGGNAGILPSVQAASCDANTLDGTYAVLTEGRVVREQGPSIPGGGASFPVAILHTLDFDGDGLITGGGGSANFGSNVVGNLLISGGNYIVNADCTGTVSFNVNVSPFLVELDFVVVDDGKEFRFVTPIASLVQFGDAKKQTVTNCDDGTLNGTYGLLYRGNITSPPPVAFGPAIPSIAGFFPAVFAVNLDFNGAGEITGGVGSFNVGTLVIRDNAISGNYSVNSDCTGNLSSIFDFGGPARINGDFVIVDTDEFRFLSTFAPQVLAGDAKKQ